MLLAACKNSAPGSGAAAGAPSASGAPAASSAPAASANVDMAPAAMVCAGMQGCVGRCRADDRGCAAACIARLTAAARPYFARLEACVAPACAAGDGGAAPCRDPASFACQLCVMSHCAQLATACLAH
ncbi:MAG TPA: hypothetical protein VIA18_33175 [Polyangia bacterium]|nr:hypothetical protein [Polyangia bacterium]